MQSFTEENYLKVLFNLSQENGDVTVQEISNTLGIKMPTVTSMMKKLAEKQLVHYESYKPIKLTKNGEGKAIQIIRKHRLTEMFLTEKMGFSWENVHEIAEQMEHIHSVPFFEKMDELLGFPKIDPHGSPIPDKQGNMIERPYIRLTDCLAAETVILRAIYNSSTEFLKFLNSRDLKLGDTIEIKFVETYDRSMQIAYANKYSENLSYTACSQMLVEKIC
jgi:DtxR family transcriptional regulator, Mn-dependent transcriptional regulator